MKVKCNHSDELECFLNACRNECHHFFPHERIEESCGKMKCSTSTSTFYDCRCKPIEEEEK